MLREKSAPLCSIGLAAGLTVLAATCPLLLAGCISIVACSETAERSVTVAVDGAEAVHIVAEAGSLQVNGRADLDEVVASGTACARTQSELALVQFSTRVSGTTIIIEARTQPVNSRFDVIVEVPDSLQVRIDDGSGEIRVHDVAAVRLTDGSGGVDISGVSGDVDVDEDGSGDLFIEDIVGSVEVRDDGSGDITIREVGHDVVIGTDGSGGISVEKAGGDVEVDNDGSGGILVSDVDGSFRVGNDGSGDITARRIKGDFVVGDAGDGDVRYSDIGGSVEIRGD